MEIQKDIGEEIMEKLGETGRWITKAKKELSEKDMKIAELETKLQKYK